MGFAEFVDELLEMSIVPAQRRFFVKAVVVVSAYQAQK
jgi:hypothetical protein